MEKAIAETGFAPTAHIKSKQNRSESNLKEVDSAISMTEKKGEEEKALGVFRMIVDRQFGQLLSAGRQFVQKNPMTGIAVSTTLGIGIGLILATSMRSIRK